MKLLLSCLYHQFYPYLDQYLIYYFFLLFQLFNKKIQKITKNARVATHLCVHKFFHEQKEHAFLQKTSVAKSLSVRYNPESSRAIFNSKKKNEKKNVQKTRSRYTDGHQNRFRNDVFFHAKASSCSH